MQQSPEHSKPPFNRRKFIGNTLTLAVLAGIVSPLEQGCKNKSSQRTTTTDSANKNNKTKGGERTAKRQSTRRKWNQEKLVINSKTNVVHLPTAVVYHYYDPVGRPKDVSINGWESAIQGEVHFNRDQSGNILEALALQKLRSEVNDGSLNNAITTLARAFRKDGDNKAGVNLNSRNYRLHELMLQLVALNGSIPATGKWQAFNDRVKKPQKPGKRQKWMETETSFNERVKYIQEREADYKKRLSQRASKYSLT
jgi:hypothetical protein